MNENVIETRGLTRYYGRRCVVDMLDLSVPRGCIFGFLGRRRSVQRERCEYCGAVFEKPARDGTEIFDGEMVREGREVESVTG